jgi:hypothetical protein
MRVLTPAPLHYIAHGSERIAPQAVQVGNHLPAPLGQRVRGGYYLIRPYCGYGRAVPPGLGDQHPPLLRDVPLPDGLVGRGRNHALHLGKFPPEEGMHHLRVIQVQVRVPVPLPDFVEHIQEFFGSYIHKDTSVF